MDTSRTTLVMTLIGDDHPGLVDSIASEVSAADGNWVESRMAHLGGFFAGLVRIEIAAEKVEGLRVKLEALERKGLTLTIKSGTGPETDPGGSQITLELVGQDRPGIVSVISRILAARNVNVEELSTECVSAPMSGETLFKAIARLRLPQGLEPDDLRGDLERAATDLLVDVSIEEKRDIT